jgi:hypothetical protein
MPAHRALQRSIAVAASLFTSAALGAQSPTTAASPRPRVIQQTPTALTQLKVVTVFIPADDPGRFTLYIDGTIPGGLFGGAANLGNNGTTGFVAVSPGPHVVSRTGALGTNANDYTTFFSAICPAGNVTLPVGVSETCTITNVRKHGSWIGAPGTHLVTVCAPFPSAQQGVAAGRGGPCTIYGNPGQTIPIVVEAWGAGGGGGPGQQSKSIKGGDGGGGGGGGGYGRATVSATVPANGSAAFHVVVGAGGIGGVPMIGSVYPQGFGHPGGLTEVRVGSAAGSIVVKAMGGARGEAGWVGSAGGGGGAALGGLSTSVGLSGASGGVVTGCHGGGGGAGGTGGGPGAINGGGNGGHGGYYNGTQVIDSPIQHLRVCSAESKDNGLTSGLAGKNGAVKLAW